MQLLGLLTMAVLAAAQTGDLPVNPFPRQSGQPLAVERVEVADHVVRFTVRNYEPQAITVSAAGQSLTVPAQGTAALERPVAAEKPLEAVSVELRSGQLATVSRTVFLYHDQAKADWIARPLGQYTLEVARDGTVARFRRGDQTVAALAPLVLCEGAVPALRLAESERVLRFQGEGIEVALTTEGDELSVSISADRACEGPVVRALGGLEQGLFAGLEYLGRGEKSSSTLDVRTPEHLRYAPDPLKVTMPLMAFVTDRASVAMTWSDMQLQPVFATPNFFDATADHRMALRGQKIEAVIRLSGEPLEQCILWAVKKHGLPPVPEPPRSRQEQWKMCLEGLNGPLKNSEGWGHCVEPRWPRQPYSDMASTVWRLTGQAPDLARLVPGGAHVRNESIYFVTGRAAEWRQWQAGRVAAILREQQADGSFHYDGKYREGHYEDTASGVCARPAMSLLEYAWITGDPAARQSGLKALEYMKRFRTPRGAQVWEVPLHTPDQLASAYAVWAYVRGYELTGNREYLAEARKWALSGVPFVYLWGSRPIMVYSTPPVFGATNWQAPCWIGLPVQWVGLVYAYSLTMLAPYDQSLDWNQLARGILVAGEQMQVPDGPNAGLLPDSFELRSQERRAYFINPCTLVSLRMVLDGELDNLAVAADAKHRVAAPFPVTLRDGQAHVEAKAGVRYQVLIDGDRTVDVGR